jgi:hypothetical protein
MEMFYANRGFSAHDRKRRARRIHSYFRAAQVDSDFLEIGIRFRAHRDGIARDVQHAAQTCTQRSRQLLGADGQFLLKEWKHFDDQFE